MINVQCPKKNLKSEIRRKSQTPKLRPLRSGVFALIADGMAGQAGAPSKVEEPPSLGSYGAPSKVNNKVLWNGLERSKSNIFDMWAN
jgi:hypothetical protein